jgi:8-oxo-dGTP pyrophosphatase MutT (NUDIX family)
VIINEAGHILLQRRSDDGQWGLPGGAMEPGEEPAEAVVREVWEETALQIVPDRIVGVYGGPEFHVRYPGGDEAAFVSIAFACRPVGGEPRVNDDESLEVRYFAPDALPAMEPRHHRRIADALRYDPRARFTPSAAPPRSA